jgi:hypothetical protein
MTRTEVLQEINKAFEEVEDLIHDSYERGGLNSLYLEPKFKEWFAKKIDELEKNILNSIKK